MHGGAAALVRGGPAGRRPLLGRGLRGRVRPPPAVPGAAAAAADPRRGRSRRPAGRGRAARRAGRTPPRPGAHHSGHGQRGTGLRRLRPVPDRRRRLPAGGARRDGRGPAVLGRPAPRGRPRPQPGHRPRLPVHRRLVGPVPVPVPHPGRGLRRDRDRAEPRGGLGTGRHDRAPARAGGPPPPAAPTGARPGAADTRALRRCPRRRLPRDGRGPARGVRGRGGRAAPGGPVAAPARLPPPSAGPGRRGGRPAATGPRPPRRPADRRARARCRAGAPGGRRRDAGRRERAGGRPPGGGAPGRGGGRGALGDRLERRPRLPRERPRPDGAVRGGAGRRDPGGAGGTAPVRTLGVGLGRHLPGRGRPRSLRARAVGPVSALPAVERAVRPAVARLPDAAARRGPAGGGLRGAGVRLPVRPCGRPSPESWRRSRSRGRSPWRRPCSPCP